VARYRVLIKPSAAKELEAVDQKKDRQRIVSKILSLAEDPRPPGHEKLAGREDRYRVRSGRYRIIYSIGDAELEVVVVRVGHRREVYR
jgi:mRNA interferase RelE/StbE